MNDGSSTMFAELPDLLGQRPLSSRTSQGCLPQMTGTLWPESVRRWPSTVSTNGDGRLYEHPTSAPLMDGSAGSVLPTPAAADGTGGRRAKNLRWDGNTAYRPSGAKASVSLQEACDLMPTPRSSDSNGPGHHGDGGMDLRTAVTLLPTPTAGKPRQTLWRIYSKRALIATGAIERPIAFITRSRSSG